MPDELKPISDCPFCGGEASLSECQINSMKHAYVECLECAASSDASETPILKKSNQAELEAIVLWNKRVK